MTGRSLTAQDLHEITFPVNGGIGYETEAVDHFIEGAARALGTSPEERAELGRQLADIGFPMAIRQGYDVDAVEDVIRRLAAQLGVPFLEACHRVPANVRILPATNNDRAALEDLARVAHRPRGVRFRKAGLLSQGLSMDVVDDWLDHLVPAMLDSDKTLTAAAFLTPQLPTVKSGYRVREVRTWQVHVTMHVMSRFDDP